MLQTICLCNIFETRLAHFLTEINDKNYGQIAYLLTASKFCFASQFIEFK